jgi:hypothetical protein
MSEDIFIHCQNCPVFVRIWEGVDILGTIEKDHRFIQRCEHMRNDIARKQKSERIHNSICSDDGKAETDDIEKLHHNTETVMSIRD